MSFTNPRWSHEDFILPLIQPVKGFPLKQSLRAFDDLLIKREDYETASKFSYTCRNNGIQGSQVDFLICAAAHDKKFSILTTDKDFEKYSKFIAIQLHKIREQQ